jgi:hypothetical protein
MKTARLQTAPPGEKIAAKRAGRLATTPDSAKGHFVAAWAGKCSPRRAIKAQCLECVGFDRQAIAGCTGWACPLWAFRPFQKRAGFLASDDADTVVSNKEDA